MSKISNVRELIDILDNAEINHKEIESVKETVGYTDENVFTKDGDGNKVTLTNFIHSKITGLEEEIKELKNESEKITADYISSQCDKTHVMVERKLLNQMADSCSSARDEVDSIEYDAEECENYARGISDSMSDAKSSIEYVEDDLKQLALENMPEEEEA